MPNDVIIRVLLNLVTLVLSISVHEFAHAFAAHKLGDGLPESQGRLTLNPIAHVDPIGTLLLPGLMTALGFGSIGWGRPVYTNPTSYTRKVSMSGGYAIVSFAGPLSNFLLAIVSGGLLVGLYQHDLIQPGSAFFELLFAMLRLNVALFFFNLLPVPPLDGSKIWAWMLRGRADRVLEVLEGLGGFGLIIVVMYGGVVIAPLENALVRAILGGFRMMV
jgi:Zn-dependent protease